ncbi:HD domain-containing protein [Deinococcus misasensis]|uniref:HD domain-containing protein n=1 Tax=Deinococcus misasensis TaxID=392413 RepID=UPI00068BE19B|nr:HD domain-containing protein [Deinococcus misasensis]
MDARLNQQMHFIITCDRLKHTLRKTNLHNGSRKENSAEHSWHLALMALTLAEHVPEKTSIHRVIELLLVHDLVEILAGDTYFAASAEEKAKQAELEQEAARDLFALLPEPQSQHFLTLWKEFEEAQTPEAQFARALDALQPMLLAWGMQGKGCKDEYPELTRRTLLELKAKHLQKFPSLWDYTQDMLTEAVQCGALDGGEEDKANSAT